MNRMKKVAFVLLISCMMAFVFAGCGKENAVAEKTDQEKIVGAWTDTVQESSMEFFSDGTGVMKSLTDSTSFTITSWLLENGRMKLTCASVVGDISVIGDYEFINDDTFTYTSDKDGSITTYERQ